MPYVSQVAIGRRPFVSVYGADYDTPDGTGMSARLWLFDQSSRNGFLYQDLFFPHSSGVRDYIHVVDLAKGHVSAVKKLDQLATSSKGEIRLSDRHCFEKFVLLLFVNDRLLINDRICSMQTLVA